MTTLTPAAPRAAPRRPVGAEPGAWHPRSDDELIAYTLAVLWALATGRTPRTDTPPGRLRGDELIAFWADPVLDPHPRLHTTQRFIQDERVDFGPDCVQSSPSLSHR